MKQIIEVPDKVIELSYGDEVRIYIREKYIRFEFSCDGTGNMFVLTKADLQELIK